MKFLLPWLGCVAMASAAFEVVPHPAVDCPVGRTIVWTAAMQPAFDRLIGSKSTMRFDRIEPPNPLFPRMLAFHWKEEDVLPKEGWFAVAGPSTPELAKDANDQLEKLAGRGSRPFKSEGEGLAAFVGIRRDFQFAKEFASSGQAKLSWNPDGSALSFFGVKGDASFEFSEHVRVLAFRPSDGSYALQFLPKEGDDTMILYLPKEGQSMLEAMQWVETWRDRWEIADKASMEWNEKWLHSSDDLRIPEIQLDVDGDLKTAFGGSVFYEGRATPWRVAQARMTASLGVDSKGVKFQATARIEQQPLGLRTCIQPEFPRRFWFDRPFFLFLWREKAEWPYAAVWFGNADALVK